MRLSLQGLARSTTIRLVVLVFVCQVATTAAVLGYVRSASESALTRQEQETVGELQDELVAAYAAGGEPRLIEAIGERLSFTFGNTAVILLTRPDGTPLAGNLTRWPTSIAGNTRWQVLTLYRTSSVTPERIGLTAVTLPDDSRRRRARLEQWFAVGVQRIHVLDFDATTAAAWSRLLARLKKKGHSMPIKDSLIAATALAHGLTVATRNANDFRNAGVAVENPFGL